MKFAVLLILGVVFLNNASSQSVYSNYVDSLVSINKTDDAIKFLEQQITQNKNKEDAYRNLAYLYINNGQNQKSIDNYKQAIAINNKCAVCYTNIGINYAYLNNKILALDNINKAIALEPTNTNFLFSKAEINANFNLKRDAIQNIKSAIALKPNNASIYVTAASMYIKLNEKVLAFDAYDAAIKIQPNNDTIYFNRAEMYYAAGFFTEAQQDAEKAIQINNQNDNYFVGLGAIYDVQKKDSAAYFYKKALLINPNNYVANFNLYLSSYRKEDMDLSCTYLEKTIEAAKKSKVNETNINEYIISFKDACDKNFANYYFQRGIAFYNLDKINEAVEVYKLGLQKFPNDGFLQMFLANAYVKLNKQKEAIYHYKAVLANPAQFINSLKNNPRYSQANNDTLNLFKINSFSSCYASLVNCYILENNNAIAKLYSDSALLFFNLLKPEVKEVAFTKRAEFYNYAGDFENAKKEINAAISLNAKNPLTHYYSAIINFNMYLLKANNNPKNKIKQWGFSINNNFNNINQTKTIKNTVNVTNNIYLNNALTNCNTALSLDPNFNELYYIRGIIKKELNHNDYCLDILKASSNKINVPQDVLNACKR
jgi:tetratricopeptide (TPR) repeat protein